MFKNTQCKIIFSMLLLFTFFYEIKIYADIPDGIVIGVTLKSTKITNNKFRFEAARSDYVGTFSKYKWDFNGDGTYEQETTTNIVEYTYTIIGTFNAKVLAARTGQGYQYMDTNQITVVGPIIIENPVVTLSSDNVTGYAPLKVAFKTTIANFVKAVSSYKWDFNGDGNYDTTSTASMISYTYSIAGNYIPKVEVVDVEKNSYYDTLKINVKNIPSIALKIVSNDGGLVEFEVKKYNFVNGIKKYKWDFDGDAVYDLQNNDSTTSYEYQSTGNYITKVEMEDSSGELFFAEVTVDVEINVNQDTTEIIDYDTSEITDKVNNKPIAEAGLKQIVSANRKVTLDGSSSTDADEDALTYSWKQIDGPKTTLSSLNSMTVYFIPVEIGVYTFQLIVNDGIINSDPDEIIVTVKIANDYNNSKPTAVAGADQIVSKNNKVSLDGSKSSDINEDPLSYTWKQLKGPNVTLSSSNSMIAYFTPETEGIYTFQLIVNDGLVNSYPDGITINVVESSNNDNNKNNVELSVSKKKQCMITTLSNKFLDNPKDILNYINRFKDKRLNNNEIGKFIMKIYYRLQ